MSSQTSSAISLPADKRKDELTERLTSNSHAQILTVPPKGGGGDSMKFQSSVNPLQKTTIVARPIAPVPLATQLTTHALTRVGQQTQPVGNVLTTSTLVPSLTTSTLIGTPGGGLSHSLTSQGSTIVSQPGLIQLSTSMAGNPINSIMRAGTTIHPAGTTIHQAGTTMHPAGTTIHPTGTTIHQAGTTMHPAGTTMHPAGTTMHQAGTTIHQAGTTMHQAGTTMHQAGTTMHPTGTTIHQAGTTMHPAGTTIHQAGTTIHQAGTTIHQAGGHLQFPSHLPKGAAAAVSALTGPKSGQSVATAILRPGAQGATIQIPVSTTPGTLPQAYHQHIQPRSLQGSLVGTVRPGTPPVPRTGSPVITAQLQQQLEHPPMQSRVPMTQAMSTGNSVQITLQPQRTMDLKLQQQRTALSPNIKLQQPHRITEPVNKTGPRLLVDSSVKLQSSKPDSITSVSAHPVNTKGPFPRSLDAAVKVQGQIQRSVPVDGSLKLLQQRTGIDPLGKILLPKPAADMLCKVPLGPQRTMPDSTSTPGTLRVPIDMQGKFSGQGRPVLEPGKIQVQKSTLDISGKMLLDDIVNVQIGRTTLETLTGKPHVVRKTGDMTDKVQIQRMSREPPGKMLLHPHRAPGPQDLTTGKTIMSSQLPLSSSANKALHVPHPSTTLSSKVVLSQVPSSNYPGVSNPNQSLHQPLMSKSIKSGVLSVSSISSQLNSTPLSVPSLSSLAPASGASSTLSSNSIPIAKVTPQRHHQSQLTPLHTTTTTTTLGSVTMGTGTGSVTVQEISRPDVHLAGQPPGGSLFVPSVPRPSPGVPPVSTGMSLPPHQTHGDVRPDRPGVPHITPFLGSEYYCNYGIPPSYQTMMYTNMTSSQAIPQPSLRPRLITTPTPNLAASLQASIQGQPGSVSRFPPTILQVDSSRQIHSHYSTVPNTDGCRTPEKAITVTSGLTSYTLSPAGPTITSSQLSQSASAHSSTQSASPRPSILRKRGSDGTPVKKPYCALNENQSPRPESTPQSNTSSPKTPVTESRENSQSSTDTALSNEAAPLTTDVKIKQEIPDSTDNVPLINNAESSPRKKPRKQLLNAVEEPREVTSSDDEVQRLIERRSDRREPVKQEIREDYIDDEGVRWTVERTKPNIQLMNFYNRSWKARNNHFLRYQDVKPKEERRPTVNELSNSKSVLQKATGWKLYYMSAQIEDLTDLENDMCSRVTDIQTSLSPFENKEDQAATRIHELTQGTIQRCQLVNDQLAEAKNSMLKILRHQKRILEIINKHMSKRPIKKKERS